MNLLGTGILAATGEASLSDLAWSAVGLASFGAGKAVTIVARTAITRAVGTAVLEARAAAPATGVTVRSLLRSPLLTKMNSARAGAMAGRRLVMRETPLSRQLAAQIRRSIPSTVLTERVGARTVHHAQLLGDVSPDLAAASNGAKRALALARLSSYGLVGGVGYEGFDALFGLRATAEAATGSGYIVPMQRLARLTWVDESLDPEAALHLPSGH